MKKYDIAAYIWPAYTGKDLRSRPFWEKGIGEWQTVTSAVKKCDEHILPRTPLWGTVDEADPSVMEFQIKEALRHNVNVFIYDWYWYDRRPFLENCLNDGFLGAPNNKDMQFYIMWANHDAGFTWDKRFSGEIDEVVWMGAQTRAEFEVVCNRLVDKYFTLPNYYKIDGKPVFMIYDTMNLINGLGGLRETREALDWFRALAVEKGLPGLHLQMTIWSENSMNITGVDSSRAEGMSDMTTKDIAAALGFDSVTHYQFVHFVNCNRRYPELMNDVLAEWDRIRENYTVPYYPHVSVGWDNNPRFNRLVYPIMKDNTPDEFEKALRCAKEYSDKYNDVPLITINSWNEWTEMSYLEPDDVYGYGYLEAIKKVFG